MSNVMKSLAFAAVLAAGALASTQANAQQLAGTYRIREGDETVSLTFQGQVVDPFGKVWQRYSLVCNGVFTLSKGELRHDPFTNQITVNVTPIKDFLNLALKGSGTGTKGFGRTLVINGLQLDGLQRTLHFD